MATLSEMKPAIPLFNRELIPSPNVAHSVLEVDKLSELETLRLRLFSSIEVADSDEVCTA